MLSLLPDYADPRRLCALGKAYEGTVPLAQLSRVTPLLTSTGGEAAFVLQFGTDADGRAVVDVHVRAELPVQCQRCLDTVRLTVDSVSRLALVEGSDEAARLPENLDPLLVGDERLGLRSLIEDELILAVPAVPAHQPEQCPVVLAETDAAATQHGDDDDARDPGPFAALAGLKRESGQND
jgi:uncharacterized protein